MGEAAGGCSPLTSRSQLALPSRPQLGSAGQGRVGAGWAEGAAGAEVSFKPRIGCADRSTAVGAAIKVRVAGGLRCHCQLIQPAEHLSPIHSLHPILSPPHRLTPDRCWEASGEELHSFIEDGLAKHLKVQVRQGGGPAGWGRCRGQVQSSGARLWFTACERTLPPSPHLQVDLEPDSHTIYGPDPT